MGTRAASDVSPKVLVIGLDCAAPEFVFNHPDFSLPHLHGLMDSGSFGILESCHPPITVPAWSCMMSGRDPGALGVYGFRNRLSYDSYGEHRISTSLEVREPRVWDVLSDAGKHVCVVGVPQTYPPMAVNGCMVSGILTPGLDSHCTYPESLKGELVNEIGSIQFDVEDFRSSETDYLLEQIHEFRENRFAVARYLMTNKPWDFFMMVDMGVDRLHHGFWRYCDPGHPKFEEDNEWRWAVRDYYEALDGEVGKLLETAGSDTKVMVVSDHGAKALHGGVRINQWLMEQGYLVLKRELEAVEPFRIEDVDWSLTSAWGDAGYCGRVFLNVRGRDAKGIVEPQDVAGLKRELRGRLEAMCGPSGANLGNEVFFPEEIYAEVNGIAPDLMVYFGGLHWRSLGEMGPKSDGERVFTDRNDTGADDANHAMGGLVILKDGMASDETDLEGANLMDVAPTILDWMGVTVPATMQGRVLG